MENKKNSINNKLLKVNLQNEYSNRRNSFELKTKGISRSQTKLSQNKNNFSEESSESMGYCTPFKP